MTYDTSLESLRNALRAEADPYRADHEKRYLKSDDQFIGVTLPAGHRIAKKFRKEHRDWPFDDVRRLAADLWACEMHEEKRLAVQLLDAYCSSLTPEDWPMLEGWVRTAGSWDLIDEISSHLLGSLTERWPHLESAFDKWIFDDNLWVRRAALISHVLRIRHRTVTTARVINLCAPLTADREYFVQKALGWVLRECAVIDQERTVLFLHREKSRLSRMALREAVSKLDTETQQAVLKRER